MGEVKAIPQADYRQRLEDALNTAIEAIAKMDGHLQITVTAGSDDDGWLEEDYVIMPFHFATVTVWRKVNP